MYYAKRPVSLFGNELSRQLSPPAGLEKFIDWETDFSVVPPSSKKTTRLPRRIGLITDRSAGLAGTAVFWEQQQIGQITRNLSLP